MDTTTTTRPALSLAVLGMITPTVEHRPAHLHAMADSLLWWGECAARTGHAAQGQRYYERACQLRDLASTHACCGVSTKDACQC